MRTRNSDLAAAKRNIRLYPFFVEVIPRCRALPSDKARQDEPAAECRRPGSGAVESTALILLLRLCLLFARSLLFRRGAPLLGCFYELASHIPRAQRSGERPFPFAGEQNGRRVLMAQLERVVPGKVVADAQDGVGDFAVLHD